MQYADISFLGKHTGKSDPVCCKKKKRRGAIKKRYPWVTLTPNKKKTYIKSKNAASLKKSLEIIKKIM